MRQWMMLYNQRRRSRLPLATFWLRFGAHLGFQTAFRFVFPCSIKNSTNKHP
jgi:hypothetical protein